MEFDNRLPIYMQVVDSIKKDIVKGILPLGEKLPSGRDLALTYKINPNTANRIYRELEAENICFSKRGLGTYVTEDKAMIDRMREEMAEQLIKDFIDGMKSLGYQKDEINNMINIKYGVKE